MTELTERRLRAFSITAELFPQLLRTGRIYGHEDGYDRLEIVEGIPEGAKVYSGHYDPLYREFVLVVEHESFPPVAEAVPLNVERITWRDMPWGAVNARTYTEPKDAA